MSHIRFILLTALLWPQFTRAQEHPGSITVPLLGIVSETRPASLRFVWGVPGAAVLGDRLDFGYAIAAGVASSQQGFALTVSARDRIVRLVPLPGSSAPALLLREALAAPDLMVLSPTGRAAALFKQTTRQLQVITGLPANPVIASRAVPATITGGITSFAVSDDGAAVLLSENTSEHSAVWLIASDNSAGTIIASHEAAGLAFRPNSPDAVVAMATGELLLMQNGAAQRIANSRPITGVQLSDDGKHIYASIASGVASFDLDSQTWTEMACACNPKGLYAFGSGNLFALTDTFPGPLFLLDVSDALQMRIWFVPRDLASVAPHRGPHD